MWSAHKYCAHAVSWLHFGRVYSTVSAQQILLELWNLNHKKDEKYNRLGVNGHNREHPFLVTRFVGKDENISAYSDVALCLIAIVIMFD